MPLESSSSDKAQVSGLSTFVTLKDSKKTAPGYCVNTDIGTFFDGETKTN